MAKIDQIANAETGLSSRTKINEAIKTVETDSTITGTGNPGDPLSVDLQAAAAAGVDYIQFNPQDPNPAYSEGIVFYDDVKKTLSYYNEEADVIVNLAQEFILRVFNNTGSTITNGTVVYHEGVYIYPADNRYFNKSRQLGVATHDIENGTFGYVTKIGQVGSLDTSGFTLNDRIYLSQDGVFTTTMATGGEFNILIGTVDIVSATLGVITVDVSGSSLTVEVTDTNGFTPDQRNASTMSFTDVSRTFSIQPTGSDYHFYQRGIKYEKTAPESIVIANTTGNHLIYFDDGVLTDSVNPSPDGIKDVILNKGFVAFIYWNSVTSKGELLVDQRHGISMSPETHLYLYRTGGTKYVEGLSPDDYIIGDGSLDTHAQFGSLTGTIVNEDLEHILNTVASTTGFKYYYRSGASGLWVSETNAGFSFPVGGTPLPQYNEFTGATWQLTEVTSGDFMLVHLFTIGTFDETPIVFLGVNEYTSAALADAGAPDEIGQIISSVAGLGFVPIATFILECKTSFTNSVNAKYTLTDEGDPFIDWRVTEIARGATPSSHNNLSGLQLAAAGITWGHIDDQEQTIAGNKLFSNQLVGGHYVQSFAADLIFNLNNGNSQQVTLTGDLTSWTISNIKPGGSYRLYIIQDATGGREIPDPTGIDHEIDSTMVFNTDSNAINIVEVSVSSDGTSYWEIIKGKNNIGISDITKYIAISGNDSTGDGTIGTPYATLLRAIQDIPPTCSNINITFIFNEAGTYTFGDSEKTALGYISYSACELFFEGIQTVAEAGVSFTENVASKMLYTASKGGVTVAENDWRGYFIDDGVRFYPISYNSAGSDTFDVEYMRGARSGTRDVVAMQVILDMSAVTDNEFLVWNFIGLPKINFTKISLSAPANTLEFTSISAFINFDFGTKIVANDIILGQNSEHTVNNINFTGCYFDLGASIEGISSRNAMGNYNFTRCVIDNTNNTTGQVMTFAKNSSCEFREACIIGGGTNCYAFIINRFGAVNLSKTVVFRDMLALVSSETNGGRILSNNDQGYNYEILKGVSYVVDNIGLNYNIDLVGIEYDGSFVDYINKTNVVGYIDEKNGVRINIVGTNPEVDSIEVVVADSAVNQYIVIGTVSENETIGIEYTGIRNTLIEKGRIDLTNQAGTSVSRSAIFDDVGLAILKNINGDSIRLDITDGLTNGNSTRLILNITRTLTN